MKNFFYSLGLAAIMLCATSAQAVVQVFTIPAGAVPQTNLFMGSTKINSVTISTAAGGATNLTYVLTDQPTNSVTLGWGPLKLTNEAYSSVSQYLTNITKITTNFSGVLYTNTFTNAVFSYTNVQGKISNDWRRLNAPSSVVGSNGGSATITGPFTTIYGLGITNLNAGVAITITVDYDPAL